MKNYEAHIRHATRADVISELKRNQVVRYALTETWRGHNGWGDGGIDLWSITEELQPGEDVSEHYLFGEETIRQLRNILPLKRKTVEQLPGEIDLRLPTIGSGKRARNEQMQRIATQLQAFALRECGFIKGGTSGLLIEPATYAAACWHNAEISHPDDRAAHALMGYVLPEEIQITFDTQIPIEQSDEIGNWWKLLKHNLAINNIM